MKSVKRQNNVKKNGKVLKIIPLGGLHEIGKNMTVLEYGEDLIIIDCGLSFPEDEMFGIDIVIPDFSYLEKHRDKIKGFLVGTNSCRGGSRNLIVTGLPSNASYNCSKSFC